MIGLLRTYLAPYKAPIALVLFLLLVQAIANLFLPELNADIINNGVIKGDIDYILRTGGFMLLVTFALMIASIISVFFSARIAMGFGRDARSAIFRKVQTFSQVAFAFRVTRALMIQGLSYALMMGLVGGLMPAIKAARLPIATALRQL